MEIYFRDILLLHLFHNDISLHFKFLFSNESLDLCDKNKDQKD